MIGEFLYRLTPRDTAVTGIEILARRIQTTSAGAIISATYLVPAGRILTLKYLRAIGTPIANIACTFVRVVASLPSGQTIKFLEPLANGQGTFTTLGNTPIVASGPALLSMPLEIQSGFFDVLLPPGTQILGTAGWTASNAGNDLIVDICGNLIPLGNVVT